MSFALTSPISIPLIVIVAAWATCLFLGYGLVRGNAMSFVAVAVGALAVASATYLIFDLSGPYSGIFRASSGRSNRCWRGVVTSTWIGAARGLEGALTSGRGGGSPRPERFVS
jgi:hypothetical protein